MNVTKIRIIKESIVFLLMTVLITSCQLSSAVKGGGIGAAAGGAIGGLIGHKAGNTAVGVLVGAAVGGTSGALIGRKMDKQKEELQNDLQGATIQRVGEGILITFNDGLQFDVNSYKIRPSSMSNLQKLSETLNKYNDTDILIEGHTDNTGSDDYNQGLSEKRAASAQKQLINSGVNPSRLSAIGYGEAQPLEDNETNAGQQANRRVEVVIYANNKMKRMAEKGEL